MKRLVWLVAILTLILPAAAFAQEATPEATEAPVIEPIELPAVDPLSITGDIVTAGSSTVFPVSEAMAELFIAEGYAGNVTVDSIGSGGGFERFCATGEIDIANASRAIKDSEVEACAALEPARTPIEFLIGIDAVAIVVSAENDFVQELTIDQLARIYSGEYATWADVDASYPAEAIQLFSPGTDSGTFSFFAEIILEGVYGDEAETVVLNAAGIQLSEDDNVLVQGVEGSPYAIGYFGFAYYLENADALRAVSLEGVAPTAETAESGEYPLSRPLFIYGDADIFAEKPQVAAFVNFYLTNANEVVSEVGYFPVDVETLNASKELWLAAVGE